VFTFSLICAFCQMIETFGIGVCKMTLLFKMVNTLWATCDGIVTKPSCEQKGGQCSSPTTFHVSAGFWATDGSLLASGWNKLERTKTILEKWEVGSKLTQKDRHFVNTAFLPLKHGRMNKQLHCQHQSPKMKESPASSSGKANPSLQSRHLSLKTFACVSKKEQQFQNQLDHDHNYSSACECRP